LATTLKRIRSREKRAAQREMELLAGVAALHLTLGRLRGTFWPLDHRRTGYA
jgi:hypothetical protein